MLRLLDAQGFGPVLVLNQAGVVMGAAYREGLVAAAYREGLVAAAAETEVGTVMRFGVSTVRPSEDAAALTHRMGHAGVNPGGGGPFRRHPGLFLAADVPS